MNQFMEPSDRTTSRPALAKKPPITDAEFKEEEPETLLPPDAATLSNSSDIQWFVDEFSKPEYQWIVD